MEKQIALPDSYASYDSLKKILDNQGIEINRRDNLLGFNVQDIRLIDVFVIGPFSYVCRYEKRIKFASKVNFTWLWCCNYNLQWKQLFEK
jgi:hypothetical protein